MTCLIESKGKGGVQGSSSNGDSRRLVHEQMIVVAGFLGGISFTALVLVLQSRLSFENPAWGVWARPYFITLTSLIAGVSSLFISASVYGIAVAAGIRPPTGRHAEFADNCFTYGFPGLLLVMPLLFAPIDVVASVIILVIVVVLYVYPLRLKS